MWHLGKEALQNFTKAEWESYEARLPIPFGALLTTRFGGSVFISGSGCLSEK